MNGKESTEIDLAVLRRRELKWLHMFETWDKCMVKNYQKVRSRCRKGIPPATRPKAWFYLCGAKYMMEETSRHECMENGPTKFEKLSVSIQPLRQYSFFVRSKKVNFLYIIQARPLV